MNYLAIYDDDASKAVIKTDKTKDIIHEGSHRFMNVHSLVIEHQPYRMVFDGELYNEPELRRSLQHHEVNTDALDQAALLIYAYRIWGFGMMNHLLGGYTLLIDDGTTVFIAKDPMGLRPLFYAQTADQTILISDQIQTLLDTKLVSPIVDRNGLRELFALGPSISEDKTLYRDIRALPMGHYLTIRDHKITVKKYYDPISKPHFETYEDTLAHIRYLVEDAINRQSVGCDATFLSGGLDSSIIAAVMAKTKQPLSTYSLDYEGNSESFQGNMYQVSLDQEFIETMQKATGSDHTQFTIRQSELVDELIPALAARHLPGMADVDAALLWLCKQVKKDRNVIMSGECSDEVFGGYPWFYREELANLDTFPWLRSTKERKALLHESLQDLDLEAYLDAQYQATIRDITYLDSDSEADRRARLHTILCLHWFMQTLVTRQVCMGDAAQVTIRAPFADVRILDYVYNIPWEMKFHGGEEKGILRAAFADLLPQNVAHRKKNPFPKTHNPQYRELIKAKLTEVYQDSDSILHQLFDDEALKALIESGGSAFTLPWYGQLMSGPQLLAYLYQIHTWFKRTRPILKL